MRCSRPTGYATRQHAAEDLQAEHQRLQMRGGGRQQEPLQIAVPPGVGKNARSELTPVTVTVSLYSVVESNCGTDVILRIYEFTEIQ